MSENENLLLDFAKTAGELMIRLDRDVKGIRHALDRIDARLDMIESRQEVMVDVAELVRRDSLDDGIAGVIDCE